jgi:hypothetical protein
MYKLLENTILRLADSAIIPKDVANTDYKNYLDWVAAGNTPEPADVPATILASLSPAQVRLVLLQNNLLDTVESAVAASDRATQIEWQTRTEFKRDNALLNTMAASLGLTSQQVDEMFLVGITL